MAKRPGWTLVRGALLLSRNAAPAAAWQPRTTDWATHPAPVIGDWGFNRPGFPKGLYLHGVTMPEGRFPAQALPNPIIYDNDKYADVLDDDVLCAMASLGKLTLAAQIITPLDPKGAFNSGHHHQGWGDDAYSDGNIFVAWQPALYRNALLRNVRGGQVIDHDYDLNWLDRRAVHAASFPFLSNPDAYRDCDRRPARP